MMNTPEHWLYPSSLKEAEYAQHEMAQNVILEDVVQDMSLIGGMDVSCNLYDPNQMIYAAVVVLSYPKMSVQETQSAAQKQRFPYVPGFLGFREAPALVEGFKKLEHKPQLLFVDGHGVSHPRGLGIASHLGVLLDIPTIGVAKSILVGHLDQPLGKEAGSRAFLVWKNKTIAVVLRSKKGSNPLLISVGHKISLETAVKLVQDSLRGYRLPEPTRHAHLAANVCRQKHPLPILVS